MNTKNTKEYFEELEVVALKADKGLIPDAVKVILTELGNPKEAIPFYAIYGPALAEPITLKGPILFSQVEAAIEKAKRNAAAAIASEDQLNWLPFSQDLLDEKLADGKAVFISFEGPGSVYCATNRNAVLDTLRNKLLFEQHGVVALLADKGENYEAVSAKMVELGNPHAAIPFYAVYGPKSKVSFSFGGIITHEQVAAAIESATNPASQKTVIATR